MKPNIGPKNRAARLLVGIILISISVIYGIEKPASWIGIAVGVIVLLEGLFSYCLLHGAKGTCDMR